MAILKNNKAAGRDYVLVEQLKNLGSKSHRWLLTELNKCVMENKIPTLWRQSMIIAILKPGMDSAIPKSYRPITVDMSKTFDTINIHTLIRKLLQTNIPGTLYQLIANYFKRRKNYTSSQRQFITGIPKVASFLQHYSTYTLQTYHHQEHQFRSWHTQMRSPSHLHIQAQVQHSNTYNHTYIKVLPGQNKTISH